MLVLVTTYSAALLALPHANSISNSKNRAKRNMYKYILEKELDDFKTFIDSNVEKIITAWEDPNSYKKNCLQLIDIKHGDRNLGVKTPFSLYEFYPGDERWGSCIWVTNLKHTLDKTLVCGQFAFELLSRRSSLRTKAETYWNPYKAKLSQSGSIYSTIKTKVTSESFKTTLLTSITSATVQERVGTNKP